MWIAVAIALATFLASCTDWLFMDLLVHRFYVASPDIWRPSESASRIAGSQAIATLATAAAIFLCLLIPGRPVLLALALWAAGPLPVSLQNLQWMRIPPPVAASHAAGWLTRLLIATLTAAWLLPTH